MILIHGIAEPGRHINPAEDWVYWWPCGCRLVLTGESLHRERKLIRCSAHVNLGDDRMCAQAMAQYEVELLNQPPR